jgi:hypothetical protein
MRNFASELVYILMFIHKWNMNRMCVSQLGIEGKEGGEGRVHLQAFWVVLLNVLCLYWVSSLFNCVSRNEMSAHWKTQISKLLILEVQHMTTNIIVLWCPQGTTGLQRSFWVSSHQTSYPFNCWRSWLTKMMLGGYREELCVFLLYDHVCERYSECWWYVIFSWL